MQGSRQSQKGSKRYRACHMRGAADALAGSLRFRVPPQRDGRVCVCVWECHQEACEGWQGLLRKGEMECLDTIGQREMQGARLGRNLGLGNVEEEMRRHDWGRPLNPLGQAQSLGLGQWHHGGIKIIVYVGGAWHHTRPTQRRQRALLGLHFLFVRHLEIALESRIFSAFQAGWGSGKKVMIFQGKAGPYAMMAGNRTEAQPQPWTSLYFRLAGWR